MNIILHVMPMGGAPPAVEYRWDVDTAILTASVMSASDGQGMTGSVELAGHDGSWVILDVAHGFVLGVEIAVWPEVQQRPALCAPAATEGGVLVLPSSGRRDDITVLQMDTPLMAEADPSEHTIHFRFSATQPARTVRIARDILVDLGDNDALRGIWLLNVPPFPGDA